MSKIAVSLNDPEFFLSFGELGIYKMYTGNWDGYDYGGCYGRRMTIEGASLDASRLTDAMDNACAKAARLGTRDLLKFIDDHFSTKGRPSVPLTDAAYEIYRLDVTGPTIDLS